MLIQQILLPHYTHLKITDTVAFAIKQFAESKINALPVTQNNIFKGLLLEADVLDADENLTIASLSQLFIHLNVKPNDYFIQAIRLMVDNRLDILPVITEKNEWLGIITYKELMPTIIKYLGGNEPGAIIILEMNRNNYSFGELSRLIETNDAYITQLNTYTDELSGFLTAIIKINKFEISDIIATLQRHEYQVKHYFGEELYENEIRNNYEHLMTYLNI